MVRVRLEHGVPICALQPRYSPARPSLLIIWCTISGSVRFSPWAAWACWVRVRVRVKVRVRV